MGLLIFLFIAVVGTSFLCSVLESILLSVNLAYISILEKKKPKVGKLLKNLKENIDESISSILILNTIANTLGATAIGVVAQDIFKSDDNIIMFISILLTFLILFVSEIIPKTIGAVYWKNLAIFAAYLIKFFIFLTYPIVKITIFVTKKINKDNDNSIISREELIHTTLLSEEDGVISDMESDIIKNSLQLKEVKIKDILTPRSVMYAVNEELTIKELLKDEQTFKFSRIPVYGENIDDIKGLILTKEVFKQSIINDNIQIKQIMKKIKKINENIPVLKALNKFIKTKEHLLLVTDNYDQTEGVVTLEDCIETLLGLEIVDEFDTVEDMRKLATLKMKQKRKQTNF